MYLNGRIQSVKEDQTGTYFTLFVPDLRLKEYLKEKQVHCAEMRLDDGRSISADQRKRHMQRFGTSPSIPDIFRKSAKSG